MTLGSISFVVAIGSAFLAIGLLWVGVLLLRSGKASAVGPVAMRAVLGAVVGVLVISTFVWLTQAIPVLLSPSVPVPSPSPSGTPTPSPSRATPSPSSTPAQTPTPSPTATDNNKYGDAFGAPTEKERTPGTTLRYGNQHFVSKSGNWHAGEFAASSIDRIQGLRTRVKGCNALRQIRYPGLGQGRKSLTFSAAMTDEWTKAPVAILGKVQTRADSGAVWSEPESFELTFDEYGPFQFDVGTADEILVSFYAEPKGGLCKSANVHIVYFDDSVHFA